MIKSALIFILCVACVFLATAFFFWNINPGEWAPGGRFFCAIASFMLGGLAVLAGKGVTP